MRYNTTQCSPFGQGAHDFGVVTDEGGAGTVHFDEVPHQLQAERKRPVVSKYRGSYEYAVLCPVASLWSSEGSSPHCSSHTSHPETSGKL